LASSSEITRILAVDDSPTYLNELSTRLRQEGYDVAPARSGQEALEILGVQRVDCILLDLLMPGLSGHQTCRSIRASASASDIPVIILTAMGDSPLIEAINAGADDYVTKSSDFDALRARVRAQLRRRQIEEENRNAREQVVRQEREAAEARAAQELAAMRAELLADLERKNHELREADRRKNEFLGLLSHELRNPLAPIRNALWILENAEPMSEQARRARAVVDRQVAHLTRLVDDLLDVTRISRGKIQLQRSRVDLAELLLRAVEDHGPLLAEHDLTLDVRIGAERLTVDADPARVTQIMGNLLQNSAKFTHGGGRVTVSLEREGDTAVIAVKDTGVGIAPEMLERVFEPFTQLDDSLHLSRSGLGLGLALVKGVVEQHGGTVEARSDGPGRGSEFVVRLGLTSAPGQRRDEPAPEALAGPGRRVLIIEDNVDAAETLREVLDMSGHEVEIAYDGRAGIEKARAFRPDVALCDITLPEMDGYAVARAIRSDPALARTLLVAVTGCALPDDERRAAEAGFDEHLAKPATLAALEKLLAGVPPRWS
jgi:signal transduction histidine kinase